MNDIEKLENMRKHIAEYAYKLRMLSQMEIDIKETEKGLRERAIHTVDQLLIVLTTMGETLNDMRR
ncbi:MAG: hypothetical protein LBT40_02390 [Deltaproteobacteria bacterium]|jgi:hypothetical protein|nr:hypothetical protein [Deltaproteobacteria bacterium]